MQEKICDLIRNIKEGLDVKNNLLKIIERFMPLICKNARNLCFMEFDDVKQELTIAIISAIEKMESYTHEGQCVNFIAIAIKNRYLELYREAKKLRDNQISIDEFYEEDDSISSNLFEEIEFMIDIKKKEKELGLTKYKIIVGALILNMSDKEIAEELKVSRQYVNRCKKLAFKNMKYN